MHSRSKRPLAVLGGALLIALSVSTALGAAPEDSDEPRGQAVAAFVHSLIFGVDEGVLTDEPLDDAENLDDEANLEEPEEQLEEGERADASAHGQCVADVARSDAVGGPNDNHGGAVSEAARETCREDAAAEEPDVEEPLEVDPLDETDTHGACVSAVARDKDATGGPNDNHGGAVSEAARETCRDAAAEPDGAELGTDEVLEEPEAVLDAPRERGNSAFGRAGGHGKGNGNGRGDGGGRP